MVAVVEPVVALVVVVVLLWQRWQLQLHLQWQQRWWWQ